LAISFDTSFHYGVQLGIEQRKNTLKIEWVKEKIILKKEILKNNRILIIEPYYGGSHQQFLKGLQVHIPAEYVMVVLPARKWKMRMQLSAIWFAEEIRKMPEDKRCFDIVLCSTFVDVAVLRVLLSGLKGWNNETCFCTYFHENQFVYPNLEGDRAYQFPAINFTTALVSDKIAFNSHYNMDTFYRNCQKYLRKTPDMNLNGVMERIKRKSIVLYPGLDFADFDEPLAKKDQTVPVVVWNHRWEYDKNPEEFFSAIYDLKDMGVQFRLIVVGQSFQAIPVCFTEARSRLSSIILHFGYVPSRIDYVELLQQGNVVVSTALQEFFGISVLEAVRAGCQPLVPERLSYPELFEKKFLYSKGELVERLAVILNENKRLSDKERIKITHKYDWEYCKENYVQWLFSVINDKDSGSSE
jgi:glycosyltransferase involved in cell wall biosynthesis